MLLIPRTPGHSPGSDQPVADGRIVLHPARLKALRKKHGWSQEVLADRSVTQRRWVSIASIKRAETGKSVLYRTARNLALLFQVELDALLPWPVDGPQPVATEQALLAALAQVDDSDVLCDLLRQLLRER